MALASAAAKAIDVSTRHFQHSHHYGDMGSIFLPSWNRVCLFQCCCLDCESVVVRECDEEGDEEGAEEENARFGGDHVYR